MIKVNTVPEKVNASWEILIIEDDPDIVELLTMELTKYHYKVRVTLDGKKGLMEAQRTPPGLIILDILLPELDGWEVCRSLKKESHTKTIPLVILTALGDEGDRIRALELGADDYIVKPFNLKELVARVRALLRRNRFNAEGAAGTPLRTGSLVIDTERHEARMGNRLLKLTPLEFDLLKYLAQNQGRAFSRDQLITALWGEDRFVEEHNLDVHIHSLRQKLEEDPAHPRFLITVRGVGYKLEIKE